MKVSNQFSGPPLNNLHGSQFLFRQVNAIHHLAGQVIKCFVIRLDCDHALVTDIILLEFNVAQG